MKHFSVVFIFSCLGLIGCPNNSVDSSASQDAGSVDEVVDGTADGASQVDAGNGGGTVDGTADGTSLTDAGSNDGAADGIMSVDGGAPNDAGIIVLDSGHGIQCEPCMEGAWYSMTRIVLVLIWMNAFSIMAIVMKTRIAKMQKSRGSFPLCVCKSGFFGDGLNCNAWAICSSLEYESMAPTNVNDRVCTALTIAMRVKLKASFRRRLLTESVSIEMSVPKASIRVAPILFVKTG